MQAPCPSFQTPLTSLCPGQAEVRKNPRHHPHPKCLGPFLIHILEQFMMLQVPDPCPPVPNSSPPRQVPLPPAPALP